MTEEPYEETATEEQDYPAPPIACWVGHPPSRTPPDEVWLVCDWELGKHLDRMYGPTLYVPVSAGTPGPAELAPLAGSSRVEIHPGKSGAWSKSDLRQIVKALKLLGVRGTDIDPGRSLPGEGVSPVVEAYMTPQQMFVMKNIAGEWSQYNGQTALRMLRASGLRVTRGEGEAQSPADVVLDRAARDRPVYYVGPLAGRVAGWLEQAGKRVLVSPGADWVKARRPETREEIEATEAIERFVRELFGMEDGSSEQYDVLRACLKYHWESLADQTRRSTRALILIGAKRIGKSFFQTLLTTALGGRCASAYDVMTGRTLFNAELMESEHLVLDDETRDKSPDARLRLGEMLKKYAVNPMLSLKGKYQKPLDVAPIQLVTMSLNDSGDNLEVLPPYNEAGNDKWNMFKLRPARVPGTGHEKPHLESARILKLGLPGWLWRMFNEPIPEHLLCPGDYGSVHYVHPDLVESLIEPGKEAEPATMFRVLVQETVLTDPAVRAVGHWTGTARELRKLIASKIDDSDRNPDARLIRADNQVARYLNAWKQGQLIGHGRPEIEYSRTRAGKAWTLRAGESTRA